MIRALPEAAEATFITSTSVHITYAETPSSSGSDSGHSIFLCERSSSKVGVRSRNSSHIKIDHMPLHWTQNTIFNIKRRLSHL